METPKSALVHCPPGARGRARSRSSGIEQFFGRSTPPLITNLSGASRPSVGLRLRFDPTGTQTGSKTKKVGPQERGRHKKSRFRGRHSLGCNRKERTAKEGERKRKEEEEKDNDKERDRKEGTRTKHGTPTPQNIRFHIQNAEEASSV